MGAQRITPFIVGGVAAVAIAGVTAGVRRRARALRDAHALFATRFALTHEALRRNLWRYSTITEGARPLAIDPFGELVQTCAEFLVLHHEVEDRVIFPELRRHGRLRSTDAAHLDRFQAEHREINLLGERLGRAGAAVRSLGRAGLGEVASVATELGRLLAPHFDHEEEILAAERLAEMVPARAILALERGSRRLARGQLKMAAFLAHSLEPDEQRAAFGTAPWIFRRLILPLADRRLSRAVRPLTVSPMLSL